MRLHRSSFFIALGLCIATGLNAQTAPQIVWSQPTPSGLANSIVGVGWSPAGGRIAVGSTDRWVRARTSSNGALQWSTLQVPIGSGTPDQTIFSDDSALVAAHNTGQGWTYRVHRASDGVFIGKLLGTLQPNGVVTFAPDAQLVTSTGDATFNNWRLANFAVVRLTGSGYKKIATNWVFSPNNALQAFATQGTITIQRRSDGTIVQLITGGNNGRSATPMQFSPDSLTLAAWSRTPNETTLFRVTDGAVLRTFPNATSNEGVTFVRFSPGGTRLVTTGYQPFETPEGFDQRGMIRFWRVSDGAMRHEFSQGTSLGVTSPVAWNPGFTGFAFGTYDGHAVVATVPSP